MTLTVSIFDRAVRLRVLSTLVTTVIVTLIISNTIFRDWRPTGTKTKIVSSTGDPTSFLLYDNLSCPFEWSKYSCSHQGQLKLADSSLSFVLSHIDEIQSAYAEGLRSNQKVLIIGDSLMRQVFIGLACGFFINHRAKIERFRVDWSDDWPCHGTSACVKGGVHSGFNVGSIIFNTGAELHYLPHSGTLQRDEKEIFHRFVEEVKIHGTISLGRNTALLTNPWLSSNDVLVANAGIHYDTQTTIKPIAELGALLQKSPNAPRFMYITTPTQHFPTNNGQYGKYNKYENKVCLQQVKENPRRTIESHTFKVGSNVDALLIYNDLDLGLLHIGNRGDINTNLLDCSHYCLPGVPDVVGSEMLSMIEFLTK